MLVGFAEVVERAGSGAGQRKRPENAHVVPVAVVLGEIPEAFEWIKQKVLVPAVGIAIHVDRAALKSDDVIWIAANCPTGAKRNEWRVLVRGRVEFLQDF